MTLRTSRHWAGTLAVGLVVGLPAAAFLAAPARAAGGGKAPGSRLAGINTTAAATGSQVAFLAPGILPVGDSSKGELLQASLPYATSTASTGPSTAGLASPAWPGDVVANGGNSIQTFDPTVPKELVSLLNDPVAAHSAYPAQLNTHKSATFSPPGGSQTGAGNASTQSAKGGTTSSAQVSNTSPLGAIPGSSSLVKALTPILKGPVGSLLKGAGVTPKVAGTSLINVGSSTARTSATVNAASVATGAQTQVNHVTIAGIVKIAGISSNATAGSDGKLGSQHSQLHVSKATVAGIPASIGPKGISLDKKAVGEQANAVATANKLLDGLKKSGVTIATIAPVAHKKGSRASVTSGAVQIEFKVKSIPNLAAVVPQLPLPLPNSAAVDVDLGLSQTGADSTRLPPIKPIGKLPPTKPPGVSTSNTGAGGGLTSPGTAGTGASLPGGSTSSTGGPSVAPLVAQPAADSVFGVPVRVAWVVIGFLLSLMVAGPLLGYANWQLLRGRVS